MGVVLGNGMLGKIVESRIGVSGETGREVALFESEMKKEKNEIVFWSESDLC